MTTCDPKTTPLSQSLVSWSAAACFDCAGRSVKLSCHAKLAPFPHHGALWERQSAEFSVFSSIRCPQRCRKSILSWWRVIATFRWVWTWCYRCVRDYSTASNLAESSLWERILAVHSPGCWTAQGLDCSRSQCSERVFSSISSDSTNLPEQSFLPFTSLNSALFCYKQPTLRADDETALADPLWASCRRNRPAHPMAFFLA